MQARGGALAFAQSLQFVVDAATQAVSLPATAAAPARVAALPTATAIAPMPIARAAPLPDAAAMLRRQPPGAFIIAQLEDTYDRRKYVTAMFIELYRAQPDAKRVVKVTDERTPYPLP